MISNEAPHMAQNKLANVVVSCFLLQLGLISP